MRKEPYLLSGAESVEKARNFCFGKKHYDCFVSFGFEGDD
jgi:hypothetical protein